MTRVFLLLRWQIMNAGMPSTRSPQYGPLVFRDKMVLVVKFSSILANWILLAEMIILAYSRNTDVLLIGIIIMSVTVNFAMITLPVEFHVSKWPMAWLYNTKVANEKNIPKGKKLQSGKQGC